MPDVMGALQKMLNDALGPLKEEIAAMRGDSRDKRARQSQGAPERSSADDGERSRSRGRSGERMRDKVPELERPPMMKRAGGKPQ